MDDPRPILVIAGALGALVLVAACGSGSDGSESVALPATQVGQAVEPDSPDNAPLTVSVGVTPSLPRVGEEVVFQVRAEDPDAEVLSAEHCTDTFHWFGDEEGGVPGGCTAGCSAPPGEAPRPRHVPRPGLLEQEFRHVYEEPGTYKAHFSFSSRAPCSSNPYGSTGAATVVVPVQP